MPTILIADRSDACLDLLEELIGGYGLGALRATGTDAALALALARRPACVLIDAFMPEMAGFHAVRRLTRDPRTADIPAVMMAAPAYAGHKVRALWYGARDFVLKPIGSRDLETVLIPIIDPLAARQARRVAAR